MKNSKIILGLIVLIAGITTAFTYSSETPERITQTTETGENFVPKDPKTDNLLTAENTVLLVIDWQDEMLGMVKNIDQSGVDQ